MLREWRRARVRKRKARSRQTYVLAVVWLMLLGLFGWSLSFLSPSHVGRPLTLSQLTALAGQHRVVSANFLDQDAQIVGAFRCQPAQATTQPAAASVNALTSPIPAPECRDGATTGAERFFVPYPKSDAATGPLLQLLNGAGAAVSIDPQADKADWRIVTTLVLPLMILVR